MLHSRGDQMNGFTRSRHLASNIRGAKLVALESNNHIVLDDEPAWPVFLRELTAFLAPDRVPAAPVSLPDDRTPVLSPPRAAHPWLAAAGHNNDAIAAELVLSVRTVEPHLQNAYAKLGLHGGTARPAAVVGMLSSTS